MNADSLRNLNSVNSLDDLIQFLDFRNDEAITIVEDIDSGLEELKEAHDIIDNRTTIKGQFKWFGRKVKILKDPIPNWVKKVSKIRTQILNITNHHICRILCITDGRSIYFNSFPFEIKLNIIRYLDYVYQKEMDDLANKLQLLVT